MHHTPAHPLERTGNIDFEEQALLKIACIKEGSTGVGQYECPALSTPNTHTGGKCQADVDVVDEVAGQHDFGVSHHPLVANIAHPRLDADAVFHSEQARAPERQGVDVDSDDFGPGESGGNGTDPRATPKVNDTLAPHRNGAVADGFGQGLRPRPGDGKEGGAQATAAGGFESHPQAELVLCMECPHRRQQGQWPQGRMQQQQFAQALVIDQCLPLLKRSGSESAGEAP